MTIVATVPDVEMMPDSGGGSVPATEQVVVTDTTELRWFAEGPLPPEVIDWFTHDGSLGFAEERVDTYQIDGRLNTGIKRRFGETLELKVRQSLGERLTLGNGLSGRLEVWRRWSPAGCLVNGGHKLPWVDVSKSVIKRRCFLDTGEFALSANRSAKIGAGCDVEIAAVTVDNIEAWTFAFAAFGPIETRPESLLASMDMLLAGGPSPDEFGPFFGLSRGYPEWLAVLTSRSGAVSACDLRRR